MRQSSHVLLALAACCACAALVAAQADPNWVDPNLQTEGFSASMTAAAIAGNPLGLTPVRGCMLSAAAAAGLRLVAWFSPRRCRHRGSRGVPELTPGLLLIICDITPLC